MKEIYLVVFKEYSNLVQDIVYKLENDKKDIMFLTDAKLGKHTRYSVADITKLKDIKQVIVVDCEIKLPKSIKDIIYISNVIEKRNAKNCRINYIRTDLVLDNNNYTNSLKQFLFKKGQYNNLNKCLSFLMTDTADNVVIDVDDSISEINDYIFDFDSINESYKWLIDKAKSEKNEIKVIEFYIDRVHDDSDKEIKYLIERTKNIQNGKKITEIFVYKKRKYENLKKNFFYMNMIKNISDTYKVYLLEEEKFKQIYKKHYEDTKYGAIIYDDCIYKDYLDNEISLGYVDCKQETIDKYKRVFEDIKKISKQLKKGK